MKTILVCEDDNHNRQGFTELLSLMGYNVLQAGTGKRAIETCQRHNLPVDLLISDVELPDVSGTDVALALTKSNPRMPILLISGNPMVMWNRRDLRNLKQLPSALVGFLEKPFRLTALQKKMGELFSRSSAIWKLSPLPHLL